MKKIPFFVTALILLLSVTLYPVSAKATATGTCGNDLNWYLDTQGTLTISGSGAMADFPLGSCPWGSYRQQIQRIVIQEGVTSISDSAFSGCYSLRSLHVAGSVREIGEYAFDECFALTDVVLQPGLEIIRDYAFNACGFQTIELPDTLLSVGGQVFSNNSALLEVTFPEGVSRIGKWIFAGCPKLTSVSIPKSVTELGSGAFHLCPSLTTIALHPDNAYYTTEDHVLYTKDKALLHTAMRSICGHFTIPDTVITVDHYAFEDCTRLTGVTIPNNVVTVQPYAFYGCTGLAELIWPSSMTAIGEYTFSDCTGLKRIVLPDNLKSIDSCAFARCSSLTSVEIPDSVTTLGLGAFIGCQSLQEVKLPANLPSINSMMFRFCTNLTSITIPETVSTIGDYAFGGTGLTQIDIPENVKAIRQGAFSGCASLNTVIFAGDPPSFHPIAFDGTSTTAFYPKDNIAWTGTKLQNYGGTITWKAGSPCEGGHSFGQWEIVASPTCDQTGLQTAKCLYCDRTRSQTIPSLKHTYTATVVAPTCSQEGYTSYECTLCSHRYEDNRAQPTNHSYGPWLPVTDGEERTCASCGIKEQREATSPKPSNSTPDESVPYTPAPDAPTADVSPNMVSSLTEPKPATPIIAIGSDKASQSIDGNSKLWISAICAAVSIAVGITVALLLLKKKK